jgi:peptide methionine sulfoxide reductase msrA/msrB
MKNIVSSLIFILISLSGCTQNPPQKFDVQNLKQLTPQEERVIVDKGTEAPFSGKYVNFFEDGTYKCKRCGAVLFNSNTKFKSECGWPSFDEAIPGAVVQTPDPDGMRTEITCAKCVAHLGHVFKGEGFTNKNTRFCVNSISMDFSADKKKVEFDMDTAIFAGGCFWGVQYYMQKSPGVISTEVGYIGGTGNNPSYEKVCSHTTGYAEAVRVVFNPGKTNYENVAKLFFEIHDPTQLNRQGPDMGDQYRSAVFYSNDDQKHTAEHLISILEGKGLHITTQVVPATKFWKAEDYHQDHYEKNGGTPYCHRYEKRF